MTVAARDDDTTTTTTIACGADGGRLPCDQFDHLNRRGGRKTTCDRANNFHAFKHCLLCLKRDDWLSSLFHWYYFRRLIQT